MRGTRLRGKAEENESETCGAQRVREAAAGIKHKTVYVRWRKGPLKGHRAVGWPRGSVSNGAGSSSRLLHRPILSPPPLPLSLFLILSRSNLLSSLTVLLLLVHFLFSLRRRIVLATERIARRVSTSRQFAASLGKTVDPPQRREFVF